MFGVFFQPPTLSGIVQALWSACIYMELGKDRGLKEIP